MFFAILTLLSALSLAAVAGWFSIVGFIAIYAGNPMAALVMGVVTECAKLITASWLYRNWTYSTWHLKVPLIYFLVALMVATSIGVFGFLSKAHLEQTSGTVDNIPRVEQLNYQISREQSRITDNEKVIAQLDQAVNALVERNQVNRSISIRRSQNEQRKQLRGDIADAQTQIDILNKEKFGLESEVRKLEIEVGPIRYIADLFFGIDGNEKENIESAVRIFTLLIVSTLDPLAVILLIAANHTILRLRNEKEKIRVVPNKEKYEQENRGFYKESENDKEEVSGQIPEIIVTEEPIFKENTAPENYTRGSILPENPEISEEIYEKEIHQIKENIGMVKSPRPTIIEKFNETKAENIKGQADTQHISSNNENPEVRNEIPQGTGLSQAVRPWAKQENVLRELLGEQKHFIPTPVSNQIKDSIDNKISHTSENDKYPRVKGWIKEFKKDSRNE